MVVKTFRGLLADGGLERIRLSTIKGKVGYRIIKFQLMQNLLGATDTKATVSIMKTTFTPSSAVDFSDSDLLAAGYYSASSTTGESLTSIVVFDNEIFNQDIFIGNEDQFSGRFINYYIELEVIPLDDAGAEYTTLKDMRSA